MGSYLLKYSVSSGWSFSSEWSLATSLALIGYSLASVQLAAIGAGRRCQCPEIPLCSADARAPLPDCRVTKQPAGPSH
jgi:hypothetical protein